MCRILLVIPIFIVFSIWESSNRRFNICLSCKDVVQNCQLFGLFCLQHRLINCSVICLKGFEKLTNFHVLWICVVKIVVLFGINSFLLLFFIYFTRYSTPLLGSVAVSFHLQEFFEVQRSRVGFQFS